MKFPDPNRAIVLYGASYPDTIKLIERIARHAEIGPVKGFIDDILEINSFMGYPIIGKRDSMSSLDLDKLQFVNNVYSTTAARASVAEILDSNNCFLPVLVDTDIDIGHVEAGDGLIAMKGAQFGARVKLGRYCTVRMNAIVNHDNSLGDYVFIGPGAVLCGHVSIGSYAYIGAGSVIKEHIRIGEKAVVGAGAVVISDVDPGDIVAGVPAKSIK